MAQRCADSLGVPLDEFEREAQRIIDKNAVPIQVLASVLFAAAPSFLTRDQVATYLRDVPETPTELPANVSDAPVSETPEVTQIHE